jgi:hypothetical protein
MATTPNYGWVTPAPTDLVTDLPADFEVFADAVDADLAGLLGGTTGQVLTKDSNTDHDFSWQTASAGGLTQLATGTLSGASVALTSIAGTYKNLKLVVRNYLPATDNAALRLRYNNDSNARYQSATFSLGTFDDAPFNLTELSVSQGNDNAVSQSTIVVDVYDYANTTTWKAAFCMALTNNATTTANWNIRQGHLFYNQTGAITEINLFPSTGNFTSGTYILYGVS